MRDLFSFLTDAQHRDKIPQITAFNRIDGPGSSLDLREFQQSFWKLPPDKGWKDLDPEAAWSRDLPRTVGITINIGSIVKAYPLEGGKIGVESTEYGTRHVLDPDNIPYNSRYWLLRVLETMNIRGVLFTIHNTDPGVKSSGLGGSATATTAVCLLANRLAGSPFSTDQLIPLSSLLEQDMGVSITGTQEQANVVYGGVTDYVWFPWGIPGTQTGFGTSVRHELLPPERYHEIEDRLLLFHSATERASTDVNQVFRERLTDTTGYLLHRQKLALAYEFREGIRTNDWLRVSYAIREYRNIRIELCKDYLTEKCWDIQGQSERLGSESFPLGAGGGGVILIFAPDPDIANKLKNKLKKVYRHIDFHLLPKGHEFENIEES